MSSEFMELILTEEEAEYLLDKLLSEQDTTALQLRGRLRSMLLNKALTQTVLDAYGPSLEEGRGKITVNTTRRRLSMKDVTDDRLHQGRIYNINKRRKK